MHKNLSFIFNGYESGLEKGEIFFHFGFKGKKDIDFTEKITFPPVTGKIPQALLESLLDNLMLILGISYWKLYAPSDIVIENNFLSKEQAEFWNTVYTKGLGEFFYKNKIDFRNLVHFPFAENFEKPISFPRKNRSLLGLGGGKDSIVAAEILKAQNKKFDLFTVNTSEIQEEVASEIGKKPILMKRELDPKLFNLNKSNTFFLRGIEPTQKKKPPNPHSKLRGFKKVLDKEKGLPGNAGAQASGRRGTYNGHVPISVVYGFFGLMVSIFYDYRQIVVGNEKSANYGNVEYLGEVINHQWSKSEEFENLFSEYVQKFITPDISYYSLLRSMSELEVAREFVKYPKYFKVFSSCNKNFKILKPSFAKASVDRQVKNEKIRWCGKCAKCLFVFISLAAFIPKKEVVDIFGKNLFEDASLLSLFEELIGKRNFKPFECVGTPEEIKEALGQIAEKGESSKTALMKHFKNP